VLDGSDKGVHIYGLSPLAWVACGNGIYVLELLKKGHIRIEPNNLCNSLDDEVTEPLEASMAHYVATFSPASWVNTSGGASPFLRSRVLLFAENLAAAVKGADSYVEQRIFRNIRTSG
jgi:ATP-dependent helicase IRC3